MNKKTDPIEVGETYIFSLKREDTQLPKIKGLLKAKVLSTKKGKNSVSYLLNPLVTPIQLNGYPTPLYAEIDYSSKRPVLYIGDMDYSLVVKKKVLRLRMNRSVTEEEVRELGELYKPERPDLDRIRAFYKQLETSGVSEDDINMLIQEFQEITPVPILGKTFPRSSRGYTRMSKILGREPAKIPSRFVILDTFNIEPWCFCMDHPSGPIEGSIAIPVTRYGLNADTGYYVRRPVKNANYTWYYVEPDSELLLTASRVYIAKNKFDMVLRLYNEIREKGYFEVLDGMDAEDYIYANRETIPEYLESIDEFSPEKVEETLKVVKLHGEWKELYSDLKGELESCIGKFSNPNYNIFDIVMSDTEYIINKYSCTTYFRDVNTNKIYFENGGMDHYDSILSSFARLLGYDVLVFTRQPGTYGRLVSECLDVRPRKDSFNSIYIR